MKNITLYKPYIKVFALMCALGLLLGYQYIGAQWTNPPASPPSGNVEAPINIGSTAQVKSGNMGANIVSAIDQMWSDEYCDATGNECFVPTDVDGASLPSCPEGDMLMVISGAWDCFTPIF
jgi:hypothetical protein